MPGRRGDVKNSRMIRPDETQEGAKALYYPVRGGINMYCPRDIGAFIDPLYCPSAQVAYSILLLLFFVPERADFYP